MALLRRSPTWGQLPTASSAGVPEHDEAQHSSTTALQWLLSGGTPAAEAATHLPHQAVSGNGGVLPDMKEELPLTLQMQPLLPGAATSGNANPVAKVAHTVLVCESSKTDNNNNSSSSSSNSSYLRLFAVAAVIVWNCASTIGIVVVNKAVYVSYRFHFPVALSWLHVCFTAAGMASAAACGGMAAKRIPGIDRLQVAAAFAAYVVLGNLSLQLNTVGFYQLLKIGIAPAVVLLQWAGWGQTPTARTCAALGVLLTGIIMATVADKEVSTHLLGAGVGVLSTFTAALYQIWTGRKQADLSVNGNQLLQQVAPASAGLLTLMVPLMEPMGLWGGFVRAAGAQGSPAPAQGLHLMQSTLLGYDYTPAAVGTILLSCVMGLSVTLSSYWAIGMTSPLTFNVLGHVKTVLVLAAGILVFGDTMTAVKGAGLLLSMCGVVWYSIK